MTGCWIRRLLLAAAASALFARAQDVDAVWKDHFIRAQRAAGVHDYTTAEQAFQRALHEAERFGVNDSRVASTLNGLGLVYQEAKRFPDADAAFRRALAILDWGDTSESQDVADITLSLASVLVAQGRQPEALPLLGRSLSICEKLTGGQSVKSASVQCAIGEAYRSMKLWAKAEQPLRRCADTREADGGLLNAGLADALYSLAIVYGKEGKYAMAEPRFRLAGKIRESTEGIMSPGLAQVLESHAALLKAMGREKESAGDAALAAAIRRHQRRTK